MSLAFNTLSLFYALLRDIGAFVTTAPPTDLISRVPALVIQTAPPSSVSNAPAPGKGAVVTATFFAIAKTDAEAFDLADRAYSKLWDSLHAITKFGWITRLEDLQAPYLITPAGYRQGSQSASSGPSHAFQYSFTLRAVLRK